MAAAASDQGPNGEKPQVDHEAEEREHLDEAVERAVDEGAVGRGQLPRAGDPPVEDVGDAAERDGEAAPLQPAGGDEDARRRARRASPAKLKKSGVRPMRADERGRAGRQRPHEPVDEEVAEAHQELRALAVGVGVPAPPRGRVHGHGEDGGGQHGEEHGEGASSSRARSLWRR